MTAFTAANAVAFRRLNRYDFDFAGTGAFPDVSIMMMRGVPLWAWAAAAGLYVAAAAAATELAWHRGLDALTDAGTHRLDLYAASLRSELGRYEILPALAACRGSIKVLLEAPRTARRALLPAVNYYLEAINKYAGSVAVNVIDLDGKVIESSNWNQPVSFVGTNVAYRPYFADSITSGSDRFFGIETNTGQPGLYFASAVRGKQKVLGATTVKISVDQLETAWRVPNEAAMVVDDNRVVVISTVPAWKFTALASMPAKRQQQIEASRQYAGGKVETLGYERLDDWRNGVWFARLPDWSHPGRERRYLVMSHSAPPAGDAIMLVLDLAGARRQQQLAFSFVIGAFLIALLYGLYAVQRRRTIAECLRAQDALQSANDRLEATVQQRTAALVRAIDACVMNFGTSIGIPLDGQHLPLATHVQQLQDIAKQLVQTQLRRWPSLATRQVRKTNSSNCCSLNFTGIACQH